MLKRDLIPFFFSSIVAQWKLLNHFLMCSKNTIHLGLNFTSSVPQAKVVLGVKFLILVTEKDGNISELSFVT